MEFVDQIKQIAQRAEGITCSIQTEGRPTGGNIKAPLAVMAKGGSFLNNRYFSLLFGSSCFLCLGLIKVEIKLGADIATATTPAVFMCPNHAKKHEAAKPRTTHPTPSHCPRVVMTYSRSEALGKDFTASV